MTRETDKSLDQFLPRGQAAPATAAGNQISSHA
jgi:hypothetical protein